MAIHRERGFGTWSPSSQGLHQNHTRHLEVETTSCWRGLTEVVKCYGLPCRRKNKSSFAPKTAIVYAYYWLDIDILSWQWGRLNLALSNKRLTLDRLRGWYNVLDAMKYYQSIVVVVVASLTLQRCISAKTQTSRSYWINQLPQIYSYLSPTK